MRSLWQLWTGTLSQNFINNVHSIAAKLPEEKATLGFGGDTSNNEYRRSKVKWLNRWDYGNSSIVDQIMYYATTANRNAFGFDIDYINDIQYTTYEGESNGHYDWHHDTFWANPTEYDRKLSVIFQLSDGIEYEGGDFEFEEEYPQPNKVDLRKKGTVLVFPSFLRHRVTPVTYGRRNSLVSWVEGKKFR